MLADGRKNDGYANLRSYFPIFSEQQSDQKHPGANAKRVLLFQARICIAYQTNCNAKKSKRCYKIIPFTVSISNVNLWKMAQHNYLVFNQ
jgi:hypothetical protein